MKNTTGDIEASPAETTAAYLSGGSVVHLLPTSGGLLISRTSLCGRSPKKRGMFNGLWLIAGNSYALTRRCPKCFHAAPNPDQQE